MGVRTIVDVLRAGGSPTGSFKLADELRPFGLRFREPPGIRKQQGLELVGLNVRQKPFRMAPGLLDDLRVEVSFNGCGPIERIRLIAATERPGKSDGNAYRSKNVVT